MRAGLRLQADAAQLAESEEDLRRAIETARNQRARSFELRAATSLAQVFGEEGRCTEALAILSPVYESFTEGYDTLDLNEAKALLDSLR
jgi:adenylate cyclase